MMKFYLLILFITTFCFAQIKTTIAVLDLHPEGIKTSESNIFSSRLRTELFNTGRYIVLEREKMDAILKEQGFQISGCTSDECVVEIGKILGVQNIVAGDVGKIGSLYTINVRIIDVETSKILKTAVDDCSCPIEKFLTHSIKKVALILSGNKYYSTIENNKIDKFVLNNSYFKNINPNRLPSCDRSGSPYPSPVPLKNSNGFYNLALLKTAKANASSLISGYPRRHQIKFLNDGWYNNCRSWIPKSMPSWAEIDLGDEYLIYSIAFGSEHKTYYNDRAAVRFKIYLAKVYDENTYSNNWELVYSYNNPKAPILNTTMFNIKPTRARYIRIYIEKSLSGNVRIDEIEIYGEP